MERSERRRRQRHSRREHQSPNDGYPISYMRSTPNASQSIHAATAIAIEYKDANVLAVSLNVFGSGSGPGGGYFTGATGVGSVTSQNGWLSVAVSGTDTSQTPLPGTIDDGELAVDWTLSRTVTTAGAAKVTTKSPGVSKNHSYVTGVAASDAFETVLDIGCKGASGKRPRNPGEIEEDTNANGVLDLAEDANGNGTIEAGEDKNGNGILDPSEDTNSDGVLQSPRLREREVVDGVWGKFNGNVTRVDGTTMSYSHSSTGFAYNAADMLKRTDGRGQCTAWAGLLTLTLSTQGISATSTRVDPPVGSGNKFAVKAMPAQGSGAANYLVGTKADGGFNFHQVVRVAVYPDSIYDPSYRGITTKTDARSVELKYEDENVTDLFIGGAWVADVSGDALQLRFTP